MGHPIRCYLIHLAMISNHHKSLADHTFLLLILTNHLQGQLIYFFILPVPLQHNSYMISVAIILKPVSDRLQASRESS